MTPLQDAFRQCFNEFSRRIHPVDGSSIMCKLHGMLGSDCQHSHNCLGCNFNEATGSISEYLAQYQRFEYGGDAYNFYLIHLYLLVERIYIIFDIIELPQEYRARHFVVFRDVHKWANFIKHPGPFLLVHHPDYFLPADSEFAAERFQTVIDQQFVNEHYSSPNSKSKKKLWDRLVNQKAVAVLFPEPVDLTRRFCDAIEHFLCMVRTNTVYQELLSRRSTYENYFASEEA